MDGITLVNILLFIILASIVFYSLWKYRSKEEFDDAEEDVVVKEEPPIEKKHDEIAEDEKFREDLSADMAGGRDNEIFSKGILREKEREVDTRVVTINQDIYDKAVRENGKDVTIDDFTEAVVDTYSKREKIQSKLQKNLLDVAVDGGHPYHLGFGVVDDNADMEELRQRDSDYKAIRRRVARINDKPTYQQSLEAVEKSLSNDADEFRPETKNENNLLAYDFNTATMRMAYQKNTPK